MAWNFSTNNTPADGWHAVFLLKATLKLAGWVVKASSDGTTYHSSSDGITVAGSGAGGMSNLKAWFRIAHPTVVGFELMIMAGSASDDTSWRVVADHGGTGFTGGSPSATQAPDPTGGAGGKNIIGSGSASSPGFAAWFGTAGGYRYSCGAGDSASGYAFYSFAFPTGGGTSSHGFIVDKYAAGSFNVGDLDPYCVGGAQTSFWESYFAGTFVFTSYSNDGAWHNATLVTPPAGLPTDPFTSKDVLFPSIDYVSSTGIKGARGTFMTDTNSSRSTPTLISISTDKDSIVIGTRVLPWDGSDVVI